MINYGSSEESTEVRADQLVPGVWVDGHHFGTEVCVIVQEVGKIDHTGRLLVSAARMESGQMLERGFRADRMITVWGKLGGQTEGEE